MVLPDNIHEVIMEILCDQWMFDKLQGLSRPTFIPPIMLADRVRRNLDRNDIGMYHLANPVKQLWRAELVQREHIDRQYSSVRLKGVVVRLLKMGQREYVWMSAKNASSIDVSEGLANPYLLSSY